MTPSPVTSAPISEDEFRDLHDKLVLRAARRRASGTGALATITPREVIAAVAQVRQGRAVSLAKPIENFPGPDNPHPARHEMTGATGGHAEQTGLDFAHDRISMNIHGDADTHLDALCHVVYDAKLYGNVPADSLTATGATALSVDLARNGIVGRGVLLDIPRLRGVDWLEPGDHVTSDELVSAEEAQGARLGAGDIALIRVGHHRRRKELGAWNAAKARAGLHPRAVELLEDRGIAVLGSDGNSDTAPSCTAAVDFPVHVLAINALGMHLLDYLQLDDVRSACEESGRWTFLCVVAPLRMPNATGSPVNPIAIL